MSPRSRSRSMSNRYVCRFEGLGNLADGNIVRIRTVESDIPVDR